MELIKLNLEDTKKLIDSGCDCYLMITHDLERDMCLGEKRINKRKSKVLIASSKTIVLNKDIDEEDSFSILSLYSAFQKDILNIVPLGVKHDMILIDKKIHYSNICSRIC